MTENRSVYENFVSSRLNWMFPHLIVCVCVLVLAGPFSRSVTVNAQEAPGQSPWTVLTKDMSEKEVRTTIRNGDREERFVVEPGASWTLKDTLVIPTGVHLIATDIKGRNKPTFRKGFDGPLARIHSFVTLKGIWFHGNKMNYEGHGVVTEKGCREVQTRRCYFRHNAGTGFVARTHYQSRHVLNGYDYNDGYGVKHVNHHHTNIVWDSCHVGRNKKGGIKYAAVDKNSVWRNCPIPSNGGPAVVVDLPDDYKRPGVGVRQIVFQNCGFNSNAGPAFLSRGVKKASWGIVFEDCRVKDNASPHLRNSEGGHASGIPGGKELPTGLTKPVGGFIHLEDSTVDVEVRGVEIAGGNGTDNRTSYRATGNTTREIHLSVSGSIMPTAGGWGGSLKDVIGPETILTTDNASLLQGKVKVKSGTGIHGKKGIVDY